MKIRTMAIAMALTLTLSACSDKPQEDATYSSEPPATNETESTQSSDTAPAMTADIQIKKLEASPEFSDATLRLRSPDTSNTLSSGDVEFVFDVKNYQIGAVTDSSNTEILANSGQGQHIHFILNNQPYSAHYETTFFREIPDGIHHLVAFLSRSYHESVKNENSVIVTQLNVGQTEGESEYDLENPTLIYSRPKGTYKGSDTENILLDFFVFNTELSEDGNKVRAVINGNEFMLAEWAPYVITGLPLGEVRVELSLIDAQGAPIPGPFNQVTRTVMLEE